MNRQYPQPYRKIKPPRRTWFDRIFDNFGKIAAVWIIIGLAFWTTVIIVAIHFIGKFW